MKNRFEAITEEMKRIHALKNADYGNAFENGIHRLGYVYALSRLYDKYCRIENLLAGNKAPCVKDESVADTLTDLANYCIMLRMYIESDNSNENEEN